MTYPIGFWNYVHVDTQEPQAVANWFDAGMNAPQGPNYDGGNGDHVEKMRAILDAAAAKGMRVILCDSRLYHGKIIREGEDAYRAAVRHAVETFGSHPAVFGFHAGDEPERKGFPAACQAVRIQQEIAPHLTCFLNLLPWTSDIRRRVGYDDWGKYLDAFVARSGAKLLCYDCYSQMDEGAEDAADGGWDMYFRNLNHYRAAAERHGIPWWTTLLSAGLRKLRIPGEDEFRWQVNTAAAHGANGLQWFFFYMREPHVNFRDPPMDEHYERTETFGRLSRVCRTFLKTAGLVLETAKVTRVSHHQRAWGGTPLLDGGGRVRWVRCEGPLVVSEFRGENGQEYVAVVNNSLSRNVEVKLCVAGRRPSLFHVQWEAKEKQVAGPALEPQGDWGEDYATFSHWLSPGQMELVRVADAAD